MVKQITYVIVNDEGEMYAGVTKDHLWWTRLIINATLFENEYLANKANKEFEINGTVKRMKYTLEAVG